MFSKTTTEVLDEGWKNSFNATFNEPAQDEDMQQIVLGEYCDEERDLLIDDAQTTTDPGVRVPLYQEISQNMHDAYTYVLLTHNIWDDAFNEDVRGMCDGTNPDGTMLRCAINGRTWFDSVWFAG